MPDDNRSDSRAYYEAITLGVTFPVAIGLGYLLGHWLDGLLGIKPWLTIIFTAAGIAAAFINLFRAGSGSDGKSSDGS